MALKIYARILLCLSAGLLLSAILHQPVCAANVEAKFHAAERCSRNLKSNPQVQKYRDRWLRCIQQYLAVYRDDPHGPWAAAGLYHAGVLYGELYQRSFLESDRREAIDLLDTVGRHFPRSNYRARANSASQRLKQGRTATASKKESPAPASPKKEIPAAPSSRREIPAAPSPRKEIAATQAPGKQTVGTQAPSRQTSKAQQLYERAKAQEIRLQDKPELKRYRDSWLAAINLYRQAYEAAPEGPLAPAALYGWAENYEGLHRWSRNEQDRAESHRIFQQLIKVFPESVHAEKARVRDADFNPHREDGIADAITEVIQSADAGQPQHTTQKTLSQQPAFVDGLRFWSNPRYTRVVIDASSDTIFSHRELREDPSIGKPQRIYIDVHNSRLGQNLQKVIPINDNLLSDARAGQYTPDTVRVVVDIKSSKYYKIFSLNNPYRIVLDVWGMDGDLSGDTPSGQPAVLQRPSTGKLPDSAIVKQLALGVRRIVIDPGHGGKDFGAPGAVKGVHEKHLALDISRKLAEKLRAELAFEVILTRDSDVYLSLEERTAIANTQNADLFISVHTNASLNKNAHGIETFILNLATDDDAILVAARENATSAKNISDLDSILKDLMQNAKVNESTRLASYVQQGMLHQLTKKYPKIQNKGVKKAPFYVLLGAEMPSILVEAGFISNLEECRRLIDPDYQDRLCQGIVEGIKRYIQEINPMATGIRKVIGEES
jgi:N-acetylmuramoyl-L-alanine amidase